MTEGADRELRDASAGRVVHTVYRAIISLDAHGADGVRSRPELAAEFDFEDAVEHEARDRVGDISAEKPPRVRWDLTGRPESQEQECALAVDRLGRCGGPAIPMAIAAQDDPVERGVTRQAGETRL